MHRYKQVNMPQIRKAQNSIKEFNDMWEFEDWKSVLTDKSVGLNVW